MTRSAAVFRVPGAVLDTELSDEGGHPVVQLHGLTSSRLRDRLLALDLGRGLSGTRLLRYDARGHGRSTGRTVPQDYVWSNLAEDLLALLDHFFPGEKVHGVGPSMGCATLLHAAVKDPERFSGLTLMVPPTAWETRVAKAGIYRAQADLVEREGLAGFLDAGRAAAPVPAQAAAPATIPQIDPDLMPSVLRGAALANFPERDDVAKIDVPSTILAWTDDPAHPLSTAEALVQLMPDATLRVAATPTQLRQWPQVLARDVAASASRVTAHL
ncbi:alpha/beta fold hydrolase [Nocardioides yefusunii]|uniref:Alpha/beta fold hydrolase n=1 Tax=Nocardioides yefusunii TaxID=2500546 RepID=A0ABW1R0F1_9ACTN|nr:alpha/beta hydrolase [Nocardioides yefusunii]